MFCSKCGKNNPDGVSFCSGCGTAMHGSVPQPQPQPQPQKSGSGRSPLFIIIAILIVALAGAAFYYFVLREDNTKTNSSESSSVSITDESGEGEITDDIGEDGYIDTDEEPFNSAVEVLPPSSNNNNNTDEEENDKEEAVDAIKDAVDELHSYSSWNEECVMDYVIDYAGQQLSCKLESISTISDYDPYDLDSIVIDGSMLFDNAGTVQEWTYTYKDGMAAYDYLDPSIPDETVAIDPSIFELNALKEDMINDVTIKRNKITFVIDAKAAQENYELFGSAMDSMQNVDDIKYSDIDVTCKINEANGSIESYKMEFSADITTQGMSFTADYKIDYNFTVIK